MDTVVCITRHPKDQPRLDSLRAKFGHDVNIVETDLQYGEDPVEAVRQFIEGLGEKVVAIEAIAPFPVLMRLVDQGRDCLPPFIRAELRRGPDGRAVVTGKDERGRDILAFDRYVRLVRLTIETAEL